MRILYTCFLISAILALLGAAVAQSIPATANQSSGGMPVASVSIKPLHDFVKAGSPVGIYVDLINTSNHDIGFTRLLSGADSKIDVRDVIGKSAPDTRYGSVFNGHAAPSELDPSRYSAVNFNDNLVSVVVKAGQTTTWQINVTKFYDMSKPGKYSVQIQRLDPEDPVIIVKSNTVTVTVTP